MPGSSSRSMPTNGASRMIWSAVQPPMAAVTGRAAFVCFPWSICPSRLIRMARPGWTSG